MAGVCRLEDPMPSKEHTVRESLNVAVAAAIFAVLGAGWAKAEQAEACSPLA